MMHQNNLSSFSPLGLIPKTWQLVKLKDVTTKIGSGATPKGGEMAYLKTRHHYALIRSQNVFDRRFNENGLAFISDSQAIELKSAMVQQGDLLLNITGDGVTFARACLAPPDIFPACVNQHVCIIRSNPILCLSEYLLAYLTHSDIKGYIESFNAGGSRRAITKGHIESFLIPLPSLDEQRAITRILGAMDDKIELNRRMNATLEAMVHAVFRQWFVDGEEVGNWDVGKLGDVAENIRRGVNPEGIEPETHYIGLEHMPRGSIALIDWEDAAALESNKFIFKEGEFLFGKLRPYFHKVGIAPLDGVCSTDILVIVPKSPEWYGFVLGHISSVELINHTSAASTGTKMPRTNWSDIARYEIPIPPVKIAEGFNTVFLPIAQQIRANIMQSHTLASLRDSLLPKLIKGDVQVKLNEEADDG